MCLDYTYKKYRIKIRRTGKFEGKVRPEVEKFDGRVYYFFEGWVIEGGLYDGEIAMCSHDKSYPIDGDIPPWHAKGDLELIEDNKIHFNK
jgi:hypothetical protein